MEDKKEELKKLETKYFMLQMADTWGPEEHAFAEELREKMKKIREEIKNEQKSK